MWPSTTSWPPVAASRRPMSRASAVVRSTTSAARSATARRACRGEARHTWATTPAEVMGVNPARTVSQGHGTPLATIQRDPPARVSDHVRACSVASPSSWRAAWRSRSVNGPWVVSHSLTRARSTSSCTPRRAACPTSTVSRSAPASAGRSARYLATSSRAIRAASAWSSRVTSPMLAGRYPRWVDRAPGGSPRCRSRPNTVAGGGTRSPRAQDRTVRSVAPRSAAIAATSTPASRSCSASANDDRDNAPPTVSATR
jgi:hypothetical protein